MVKWTMVIVLSLKVRVVGAAFKWPFLWLINGGDPITTYILWDDPPSRVDGWLVDFKYFL